MTLSKNPLFPDADDKPDADAHADTPDGYVVPRQGNRIEPLHDLAAAGISQPAAALPAQTSDSGGANPAANLIRDKLARLYEEEPSAQAEEQEADAALLRSPHQQFMYSLSTSGKSLADIQTEWHNYYVNLPDDQKHKVWQEFYENNNAANHYTAPVPQAAHPEAPSEATQHHPGGIVVADHTPEPANTPTKSPTKKSASSRSRQELGRAVKRRVTERATKLGAKHRQNLHSLLFGLATGVVVLLIFMFGFFNEVIITPFIQPGRASATPIIVDSSAVANSATPEVIIPKINVEIPVVYNVPSNDENVIENALLGGVVHYPTTVLPGQTGNAAFFGHSSNNIFNKGKYKFAFVLLHTLKKGDTFYLTYNHTVYAYKVISRQIVEPSDVGVLNDVPGQTATATLITCDPPGTSLHRLVVVGQQISPDPAGNSSGANTTSTGSSTSPTAVLAGNGPTMWSRFWGWLF